LTARLFFKLLFGVICLLIVALAAVDYFAPRAAESAYVQNLTTQLEEKCRMTALLVGNSPKVDAGKVEALARAAGARITIVAADGRVLADSGANPDRMENHRSRPELRDALAGKRGASVRRSNPFWIRWLFAVDLMRYHRKHGTATARWLGVPVLFAAYLVDAAVILSRGGKWK
jgi:hypothetical protein